MYYAVYNKKYSSGQQSSTISTSYTCMHAIIDLYMSSNKCLTISIVKIDKVAPQVLWASGDLCS